MNVSVICACKNRANALKVSLSSWLLCDQIKEIIIVDWNSDEPINYLTKLDKRIKIVRVEDEKYFNQPQPLNLALSMATGDYILKLDTDYIINPYKDFFENYIPSESSFVSGNQQHESPEFIDPNTGNSVIDINNMTIQEIAEYVNTYSHFYKFLTGMLFVSKENLLSIGGYNETFTKYYAFEDDEICQRLELYGLDHVKLKYDYNMIHIPHSDHKRFENFKGFIESESNDKLKKMPDCEYKWQTEYFIAQKHIDNNKKMCSEIKNFYVKSKTKWNVTNIDDQNYFAKKLTNNKLDGFPSSYYVSLEESLERRDNLESQFGFYGVSLKGIISKRFSECDDVVYGKYLDSLNEGTTGCVVSHLKAIKEWYESTDDDYGFFCEDDLSLETVDYWDFTWKEFIDSIPSDADCIQMFTIRGEYDTFELRERYWDDWGASAYIVKRKYAKRLIDTFIRDDGYCLEIPNQTTMPLIENILFASLGKCYTIPLFVEEVKFQSTFVGKDDDVKDGQKKNHYVSQQKVLEWWKGKTSSIDVVDENISKILIDKTKNTEYDIKDRKNDYKVNMTSISPYEKVHNVVDCFQYNNEKELLELRVKLLKDQVDLFLIFEGNYTHDGTPKEFTCNKVINELGLPKNKIIVIEIDLSDPGDPTTFDLNYNPNQKTGSIERIQRDYLNNLLDEFDEETVFIVSDCDEIINSTNVKFVANIARSNKDFVFKIPLVNLEGRADYRVHYLNSKIYPWDRSMFVCTKGVLEKNPATHIRSEFLRKGYEIKYVTHGGEICQDLGWHFSWMGSNQNRIEKFNTLCDIKNDFISSLASGYDYNELIKYIENYVFEDGGHSCYGNFKVILKKYSILELPPIIFSLPRVEQYLIPDIADLKNSKNEELTKLLNTYSLDTENAENNFNLGVWYEDEGHTAPALSYFLRCAERATDNNLAYEALIRSSYCYQKQGTRDGSAKSLLEQALCLMPERPEAYFLLSRFAERRQWWQDCYIHADRGLKYSDFNSRPLKTCVEYPGKYGLLFEKAVGAWWWGKVNEAKELLLDIKNNYEINEHHKKQLEENLKKLKINIE